MSWDLGSGLEGKGVIVTGAAGGIGREVAKAFASTGARLMLIDRAGEACEQLAEELEGSGHVWRGVDVANIESHPALIADARREVGSVYALVHLAAILRRRPKLADVSEEDWDVQLDTNLKGAFFLCRAAAESMVEQGNGGRIIAFTSQGWWTGGFGGSVVYNASKGAIVTMTRGLARTYGPHGITVNAIAPGQVRTPMLMTDLSPDVLETMLNATPLGRIAEPEEIAGTAVFLASKHAQYITGATLNLTGGFLMY